MIWFAGILQNTCCNKMNENKPKKKPLSCVWCLLHNFAHSLALCHVHQTECVLLQTHRWLIFYFSRYLYTDDHYFSIFLDSFIFLSDWEHIFLSAPLQHRTSLFFPAHGLCFFGMRSWRNAWHHQLGSQKGLLKAG